MGFSSFCAFKVEFVKKLDSIILCLSVVQQNMRVTRWIVLPLLTKALYEFGCFKEILQKANLALLLFYCVSLTRFCMVVCCWFVGNSTISSLFFTIFRLGNRTTIIADFFFIWTWYFPIQIFLWLWLLTDSTKDVSCRICMNLKIWVANYISFPICDSNP